MVMIIINVLYLFRARSGSRGRHVPRAFGPEGPRAGVEDGHVQDALTRMKMHVQCNKLAVGFGLLEKPAEDGM